MREQTEQERQEENGRWLRAGLKAREPESNPDPMFGLNRDLARTRLNMPPPKTTLWDRLVAAWGAFKEGSRG